MSQSHIFNFFPGSVSKYESTYVTTRNIWISRLYFNISNSKQKQCLTIDTRDTNNLGPGKFRTQVDNRTRQICYYNRNKSDTSFNFFLAIRKQASQKVAIKFTIDKAISNLNSSDVSYLELGHELRNINNDNIQSKLQRLGNSNIISKGTREKNGDGQSKRRKNTGDGDMDESAKTQDFFQDNNGIKVKDTTTRVKSRNLL